MPITSLPSLDRTASTFKSDVDAFFGTKLPTFVTEANALETNVNAKEASATAAAASAATQVTLATNQVTLATAKATDAANSATSAAAVAGAGKWISGTSYAQGDCVWSPIDLKTYRRSVAGGGTTDPSGDGANWVALQASAGISNVATTSGAANITLTSASSGYQSVAMTAMGKHVSLPDATTMTVGGPRFIIKNDGGYPFGIRDNAGTLIGAVAAGGIAYVTLKNNSTAAGSWSVIGDNLEPGLITIDSTFSSTYTSTVFKPFVALDTNTSIHFAELSSGFSALVVDNAGKVVSAPVTVSATSGHTPKVAFKISATQAIVFYGANNTTTHQCVVLTLSGTSPSLSLAVGTAATLTTGSSAPVWGGEDFSGAPKIAQLSSSLYLASLTVGTNTSVAAVSVSGSTVTIGNVPDIITANTVASSTTTYALTATTALVLYKSGAAAPYANNAVVVSVSGTTCTVGTPSTSTVASSNTSPPSTALLSSTKCLIVDDSNATIVQTAAFTISGASVSGGSPLNVETGLATSLVTYTANSATRYNPHLFPLSTNTALLWYLDSSGISRSVVLSESGGTVTAGTILYKSICGAAANAAEYGEILPQGTDSFVAIRETLANTAGYCNTFTAHKISGTTITAGVAKTLPELANAGTNTTTFARLSSGTYVAGGSENTVAGQGYSVFSTNGDAINYRGAVTGPRLQNSVYPVPVVSSNRVVILGSTWANASSGFQLRLINMEIAQ